MRAFGFGVAAALLQLASAASAAGEPHFQIDASGKVLSAPTRHSSRDAQQDDDWLGMIKKAKERIAHTRSLGNKAHEMMRSEAQVRRHVPSEMVDSRQQFEEVLGLLELGEVNCSAPIDTDPITGKLCRILFGTNPQVAGKLERAVKGLSLRPKNANSTEMAVADKEQEGVLTHLKAAMWDLWFCAKRQDPPCNVLTSDDAKVKAAREQAFDALHAIHTHAEAQQATAPGVGLPATLARSDSDTSVVAPGSLLQKDEPADETAAADSPVPTVAATTWATNTLDNMLTIPNVTGKLWDAINMIDMDEELEKDIITVTKDEDGNMKKLKSNMLIMHECASMPDCPGAGCCTPKAPTQAIYLQARNAAYTAYHEIQKDDDMAKRAYLEILKNVGNKAPSQKYPPGHPKHVAPTVYPPGHPLHGTEGGNSTNNTEAAPKEEEKEPPVEEGSWLIYAIGAVTAVVVLAIGFLIFQNSQSGKGKGAAAEWQGEEQWGEGEGYGQY